MSNNVVMVNNFGEYVVIKQELLHTVYPSDREGNILDEDLEQYLDNYELCVENLKLEGYDFLENK